MKITIFRSLFKTDVPFHISLEKSVDRIKGGKSKSLVESIRSATNDEIKDSLKSKLPAILFAGEFAQRNKEGLSNHSGLMVIDFDDIPDEEYNRVWDILKAIPYIIILFKSPTGTGIKGVVKIPKCTPEEHTKYFKSFQSQFDLPYWDNSGSDVSRVCFESYDPNLYYNKGAKEFKPKLEDKGYNVSEKVVHTPLTDEDKIISRIMDWKWKYDFVEGERNSFAYALSRTFCEYGVSEVGANNFIINHFSEESFKEVEIKNTVKSAYRSTSFGIKKFIDYDKKKQFEKDIKHKSKNEVKTKYKLNDEEYKDLKEDATVDQFWAVDEKPDGTIKIKVDVYKFKIFLEQNGFKKSYLNDSQKPSFVKIHSNIVEETSIERIKDFVLNYLLERRIINVWSYFASYSGLFSDTYLLMLESIDLMMLNDTLNKSFIAFQNGILEVDKDKYKLIDYIDIQGYIWRSHIVNRDFIKSNKDNDYKQFINNISQTTPKPLESVIGYLLSTYKNKINNKAIILNDETISDNPEGGTGKGLIVQGLKQIRRVSILDGKTFDDQKSFPYQTVSKDTQILVFDDVKRNWDFESKFSIVTEGITLERKNKDALKLPVEQSPKMLISTNFVIKGEGNSHNRRRHEIEVAQYYGHDKTPHDDFGHQLFDDWDIDHFHRFDNYMIYCLQLYLTKGLIKQEDAKNIDVRKFIAETNREFHEWVEYGNLPINKRIYRSDKYLEFISEYPDYGNGRFKLSQKSFKIYIDKYAIFLGLSSNDDRDDIGRYSEILDPSQGKEEDDDTGVAF